MRSIPFILFQLLIFGALSAVSCRDEERAVGRELTAGECADGRDNDSDSRIDCEDPECQNYVFCTLDITVSDPDSDPVPDTDSGSDKDRDEDTDTNSDTSTLDTQTETGTDTETEADVPVCGDGVAEGDEACDKEDVGSVTCVDIFGNNYGGGTPGCDANCNLILGTCCVASNKPCSTQGACCNGGCSSGSMCFEGTKRVCCPF